MPKRDLSRFCPNWFRGFGFFDFGCHIRRQDRRSSIRPVFGPFATRFLSDPHDFLELYAGMLEGVSVERDARDFCPAVGQYGICVSVRVH